ncbi:MAG TPA: hypothetical protein VH950_08115 [Gaiellaceae bacterium]
MKTIARLRAHPDGRIVWAYLVGTAAGALAGLVVGGVGGRLVMLVLRLTSPDYVLGIESDDGFTIGVVSAATFQLLLGMAFLGAANGALYVALRQSIPTRLRSLIWPLFAAAVGGASVVNEDGVDFQVLEPRWFAVASFVLLFAVAALTVVLLVERWLAVESSRLTAIVLAGALVGTFGLVVAMALAAATIAWRRVPQRARRPLAAAARIAVPVLLVAVTLRSGVDLARAAAAIL